MKKGIFTILFFGALLIALYWLMPRGEREMQEVPTSTEQAQEELSEESVLNQTSCASSGGTWNACGSACRLNPGEVCIDLCFEYCECESDAQCPTGFTCGEFVEGKGICL
ncbi:hypothetical protein HQ487_00235 [Candidatus Uhrbacteria bacterium]|nr:hypothetical protein [Candidatus Uhrbacteria bacterium]